MVKNNCFINVENKRNKNFLKKNAFLTAKKYTWDKRCCKIISFTKSKIYKI